jgi:aminomethyltransferase
VADTGDTLMRTALYDWHAAPGGRMVPFAGWEMPVQYPTGPLVEHEETRTAAGLFDIDHMGQVEVYGPDAEAFVNHVVSYDVRRMAASDAHYAIFWMLRQDGHRRPFHQSEVRGVRRVRSVVLPGDQRVQPGQGRRLASADLEAATRFTSVRATLLGHVPVLFGRTGYTGEDGYELFLPVEHALPVWEAILAAGAADGVLPIGLAARDSLRFEACMPLYGHELSDATAPVEAGLGFALSLDKPSIGPRRPAQATPRTPGAGPRRIRDGRPRRCPRWRPEPAVRVKTA